MKIKIIWGIILGSLISMASMANSSSTPSSNTIIPEEQLYKKIASLKIKDFKKLAGRKLTVKEKIGFLFLKHKLKHPPDEKSKQGQTALTFGIIAVVLLAAGLLIPYVILGSLIAAILAIANGTVAGKLDPSDRKARTGKLLGWITLGVMALFLIIAIAVLTSFGL